MVKNLIPNQFDYSGIYVEGKRSIFPFKKPVQASFMSGMLVPMGDPIRVFPGSRYDLKIKGNIRSNTMVVPPLDPLYVDVFTVWIPDRIVWTHQPQFLGENDSTAWTQSDSYVYPSISLAQLNYACSEGIFDDVSLGNFSLSDKYGLLNPDMSNPAKSLTINALPFRGYYAAWNHLFRDENYQRPVLFSKGDTGDTGEFGYFLRDYSISSSDKVLTALSNAEGETISIGTGLIHAYACLMPVNKFHDAITSVLPAPQYGDAVDLSLGDTAPVILEGLGSAYIGAPVTFETVNAVTNTNGLSLLGETSTSSQASVVADLSNATASNINVLRTSVMYQRYLEALARGGRRVPEYYDSIYNVKNSTAQKDYPQLISRARYLLGVNQVVAQADSSGDGWTSHLGDTGAFSLTRIDNCPCCEFDFSEFGYLHIFYCVRAANRYSQFIQPHFLRSTLLDEYNPYFDHIGDVGIRSVVVNTSATTDTNFGYQEAWWDERTQIAMATGALNKNYGSLKYWTIGEVFDSSLVTCTPSFLTFDPSVLNDVFVSEYYAYPQFIGDWLIHGKSVKRMSAHSIPGIVGRI